MKTLTVIFSMAAGTFAYANTPTETDKEMITKNSERPFSVSIEGVYGKATKRAERGGVDLGGLDLRLNYNVDLANQFSLGILVLGGSENIGGNKDLESSNFGVLAGYRKYIPVAQTGINLYLGVRIGFSYVDYVVDSGRTDGWNIYAEDSDLCAVYAGEIGLSYSFSEQWSIRGGYEFYGNTAGIGGGTVKFNEQQYHLFQIGAEYRF